jgi:acetylornithine deacetylase/succinyl-diaminopimelate desuccinylase-like protein
MKEIDQYIDSIIPTYIEELQKLVRIPSISSSPQHQHELGNVAFACKALLEKYGFTVDIIEAEKRPLIIGTLEVDPNAPWVLAYNHMDVQPADAEVWSVKPFAAEIKDCPTGQKMIARGATDDKGPALSILHAINYMHKQGKLPVNVQICYETEEEIGSPNFGRLMDLAKGILREPASVLISDTIFEGDHPAITYKLRGIVYTFVRIRTGTKPGHSGMLGGAIKNPLNQLAEIAAKCVDNSTGRCLIPGFYDDILPLTEKEVVELKRVASVFDYAKLVADSGFDKTYTQDAEEVLRRLWHKPTIDIHGFMGGHTKVGAKTVIPHVAELKFSTRLVPGQDPTKIVKLVTDFVKSINPEAEVETEHPLPATVTPLENPFMDKAIEACEFGFGKRPLFVGSGGTIGSIPEFNRLFPNAPVILIAQSLMSDNYHGIDEEFQFAQARGGIKTMSRYLSQLGKE